MWKRINYDCEIHKNNTLVNVLAVLEIENEYFTTAERVSECMLFVATPILENTRTNTVKCKAAESG